MESFEEIGLILYEIGYAFCDAHGIVRLAHKLIRQQPVDEIACEKSIICNEGNGCGRYRCPAKTIKVNTFVRRLKELDYQLYLLAKYCELAVLQLA
jgi:hypothetical protein